VDFIEDIVPKRDAGPVFVLPGEIGPHHLGRSVNALRLITGCGIRSLGIPVQPEKIAASGYHIPQNSLEISPVLFVEGFDPFFRREEVHLHGLAERCPNTKPAGAVSKIVCAQRGIKDHGSCSRFKKSNPSGGRTRLRE
jgi:hypothetical protein